MLARYAANGALEASVLTDFGGGTDQAHGAILQPDGKILLVGSANNGDFGIARYFPNLLPDGSFGGTGKVTTDFDSGIDFARGIALQPDGKIVVAGFTIRNGQNDLALARYLPNGVLDANFDADGRVVADLSGGHDNAFDVAVLPDGRILVAGTASDRLALLRFLPDGTPDGSFGGSGIVLTDITSGIDFAIDLELLADGRILLGGGTPDDFAIVRYNANGTLDGSFGSGGVVTTDFAVSTDAIRRVAVQLNGKIVAAGFSTAGGAGGNFALARYHADGTLDTSFSFDGKVLTSFSPELDIVRDMLIQPDGKILAVGSRTDGAGAAALARYEGDPPPELQIDDALVIEQGGTTFTPPAVVHVSLSSPLEVAGTVAFSTRDGSALAGSDYQAFSGTLTFAPGQTVQAITMPVIGDLLAEPNEHFFVDLSGPVNATLQRSTARVTIVDNDQPTSTLRGAVYEDSNANRQRDFGEPGVSGVTVQLFQHVERSLTSVAKTLTDLTGGYAFENLGPGRYRIVEIQPTLSLLIDGHEELGVLGGTVENDAFSMISLPAGVDGSGYNFGELRLTRLPSLPPLFPDRAITSPVPEGGLAVLTGTILEPNPHEIFILDIDWGDGSRLETHHFGPRENGQTVSIPHRYHDNGVYTVRLAWRDLHGLGNQGELQVVVENVAPAWSSLRDAAIGPGGVVAQPIFFDDPGADNWTVRVDFGDGIVEELAVSDRRLLLRHRYAQPGSYQVRLAVIDDDGDIGTAGLLVESLAAHGPSGSQLSPLDAWFAWLGEAGGALHSDSPGLKGQPQPPASTSAYRR
jgi:uncharacterized delta-60 repeat protein